MYRHLIALTVIAGLWIGALSLTDFVDAAAGDEPTAGGAAPAEPTQQDAGLDVGPDFNAMQLSPHLFIGTLTGSVAGPVARSEPPIYSFTLTFQVSDVLRGDLKAGTSAAVQFRARQAAPPTFTEGRQYIVAAQRDPRSGRVLAVALHESTEELLDQARLAGSLPVGWRVDRGKLVSPWASLGETTWPAEPTDIEAPACSKTGRPALLAGGGIRLTCEPVPPKQAIKWTNPDGDGEYTITVTNTTDKPLDVPALLSDENGILWNESLMIVCQGAARAAPLAGPIEKAPKPTRLEPGASVSTVVNALRLSDVEWPRGGYRVEFTFCLGELAATQSFYYKSNHHDAIREALQQP